MQSAIVTGPPGEEIHTDEHGRVRVQFPWDREGKFDDDSSCWIRVSQGWAGTGFGMINLPRVGQEVLVGFLDGDPDQPVVVGRVFNAIEQVPYKLPDNKTVSGWKTNSSPGGGGYNEIKLGGQARALEGPHLHPGPAQPATSSSRTTRRSPSATTGRSSSSSTSWRPPAQPHRGHRRQPHRDHGANRVPSIGGNRQKLIQNDETERTQRHHHGTVAGNQDLVVKLTKKELVLGNDHLHVKTDRMQKVDGTTSLTVGVDQEEKVGNKHALEAGKEIHLKAGQTLVIEAGSRLTVKGPGGFIDIHSGGIDIVGTLVKINSGGSACSALAAAPAPRSPGGRRGGRDRGRSSSPRPTTWPRPASAP